VRQRWFLEPASTEVDSYVVVDLPSPWQDESALLKIADCDRRIQLWFPWGSKRAIARSRKKIAGLRKALDTLEQGLEDLWEAVS
jgi:hypothetical protein